MEVKLLAKHGDYTIEVKDKDPKKVVSKYKETLVELEKD